MWQAYDDLMKGFSERNKVHSSVWKTFDIFEHLILIYFSALSYYKGGLKVEKPQGFKGLEKEN